MVRNLVRDLQSFYHPFEGIYAKRHIAEGEVCAFFNGTRVRDLAHYFGCKKDTFTDYKIALSGDVCIDIPKGDDDLKNYRVRPEYAWIT